MPKKSDLTKRDDKKPKKRGNQFGVSLPAGAQFMVDQLVRQKIYGDSHSEVIRRLVGDQLMAIQETYKLVLPEVALPVSPKDFDKEPEPPVTTDVEIEKS